MALRALLRGGLARARRWPARSVRLDPRGPVRGHALLSYIREPASWQADDSRLGGHTNQWESRRIALGLRDLGFAVRVIDFDDKEFTPEEPCDLVMAIDSELCRLGEMTAADLLLLHITGCHPAFNNAAELDRIEALHQRRGSRCRPRRQVTDVAGFERALEMANACSLVGNEWTLSTFPEHLHPKITCIPVTASMLARTKSGWELVPEEREFLWFFGSGAVHKGLDRLLEVFAANPALTLNVVGNIDAETDFIDAYRRELSGLPNVRWHGFLDPMGREFQRVASRCFSVVSPSCAEGSSPAVATMLQLGLYPIISRETGIDLPPNSGCRLKSSELDEIGRAVSAVHGMGREELVRQIREVQGAALKSHSRESFAAAMDGYLRGVLR